MQLPPWMMRPPSKEYISPKWRCVLRIGAYATIIVAFIKYGELLEMPENPQYA